MSVLHRRDGPGIRPLTEGTVFTGFSGPLEQRFNFYGEWKFGGMFSTPPPPGGW